MSGRGPDIDWDHVLWLRSFNRSWETIAYDLGMSAKQLVDAYQQKQARERLRKACESAQRS